MARLAAKARCNFVWVGVGARVANCHTAKDLGTHPRHRERRYARPPAAGMPASEFRMLSACNIRGYDDA
jgi:hypothetical protein